jgi:uncharacterized protein
MKAIIHTGSLILQKAILIAALVGVYACAHAEEGVQASVLSDSAMVAQTVQPEPVVVIQQPVAQEKKPAGWFWNRVWHWWYENTKVSFGRVESERGNVNRTSGEPKGALVEQVVIYPKLHAQSEETMTRKGILVRYETAKATVLMCHGFMCDKYDSGALRTIFEPGKYNVMTFDFRAHGEETTGQSCSFGRHESQDVIAAAQFLRNHPKLKDQPLYVYGFSMGAVASIEAQAQHKLFDAMVLDCPFDSAENVIKRGLENLKFSVFGYEFDVPGKAYLQKYAFNPYVQSMVKATLRAIAHWDTRNVATDICPCSPAESAKKVDVPCLFIHCKNDEKVPLAACRQVYDSVTGPKKMWITNGRRHFDSYFYNPEQYAHNIRHFLDQAAQGSFGKNSVNEVVEDTDHEKVVLKDGGTHES